MVMTYTEELTAGQPRHAAVVTFRTGLTHDGKMVAQHARFIFNSGAYAGNRPLLGLHGVESALLDPRSTWRDPQAYDRKARELAQMFRDNFAQFAADAGEAVVAAGPRV